MFDFFIIKYTNNENQLCFYPHRKPKTFQKIQHRHQYTLSFKSPLPQILECSVWLNACVSKCLWLIFAAAGDSTKRHSSGLTLQASLMQI